MTVVFGLLTFVLGAILFTMRDRLGAQARAEGHGVTPFFYALIGATLVASGTLYALSGLVW